MKAILIDDEKPALLHLERLLHSDGRVLVSGKYTTAREGLEHLAGQSAEVVFLDIEMPEMNGLEAAERINQIDSGIRIVYTTAYSEYAIEAFELNALDYLLKPIYPERLAKTMERLRAEATPVPHAVRPEQPSFFCFKRLELGDASQIGTNLKWRTAKAQELFAFLLHGKGQWISRESIIETLWPDSQQDKAVTYLHTSISQIRKLLKEWGAGAAILYSQECYRLDAVGIATDVQQFEQAVAANLRVTDDNYAVCAQALELYRGDYLEEHDYAWAKPRARELLRQFASLAQAIALYELDRGCERQALRSLLLLQEKDPYSDAACRLMLTAYARLGDITAMKASYEAFVHLLHLDLEVEPERETAELYRFLLAGYNKKNDKKGSKHEQTTGWS